MKQRLSQIFLGMILLAAFAAVAFVMVDKQDKQVSIISFSDTDDDFTLVFSDVEKVLSAQPSNLEQGTEDSLISCVHELLSGIVGDNRNRLFNGKVAISIKEDDFVAVLEKSTNDLHKIFQKTTDNLDIEINRKKEELTYKDRKYQYAQYNEFLVFSNATINIDRYINDDHLVWGNADYLKIVNDQIFSCVIDEDLQCESQLLDTELKGNGITYKSMFEVVPADAKTISVYGSSRWPADEQEFFTAEGYFNWCSNYLSIVKKDSMEVCITPVGLERDLALILEEETLSSRDTMGIKRFMRSSFEVTHVIPQQNWSTLIPALKSNVEYLTEIGGYYVLSNSEKGLNWFLSAWQLGNVATKDNSFKSLIDEHLPLKVNRLSMNRNDESWNISAELKVQNQILVSNINRRTEEVNSNNGGKIFEKDLTISAEELKFFTVGGLDYIIAQGNKEVSVFSSTGEFLFNRVWNDPVLSIEQKVGNASEANEIVVFGKNFIDKFTLKNKGSYGLPKKFNEESFGGKWIHYEDVNQNRYFVGVGRRLLCFAPGDGLSKVDGWLFPEMKSPLKQFLYKQVGGRDYLVPVNMLNEVHILNRRGDARFPPTRLRTGAIVDWQLYGTNDANLHIQYFGSNYLYRHYISKNLIDSVEIDQDLDAINQGWVNHNGQNNFWQETKNQLFVFDRFGFVQVSMLKPSSDAHFIEFNKETKTYIFSTPNNQLYLLDENGAQKISAPLFGSNVLVVKKEVLYTVAEGKLVAYHLNNFL